MLNTVTKIALPVGLVCLINSVSWADSQVKEVSQLELAADFSPNPTKLRSPWVAIDGETKQLGVHRACGLNAISKQPALSFTLKEATEDLVLKLTRKVGNANAQVALFLPNGNHICLKKMSLRLKKWAAGNYRIHIVKLYKKGKARVELSFFAPKRYQADLMALAEKSFSAIVLVADRNPSFHNLPAHHGAILSAQAAGLQNCFPRRGRRRELTGQWRTLNPRDQVAPALAVNIVEPGRYAMSPNTKKGRYTFFQDAHGKCLPSGSHLEEGTYRMWTVVSSLDELPSEWEIGIFNMDQPYQFAEAPTIKVKGKKTKLHSFRVGPVTKAVNSRDLCADGRRKPDFYLKFSKKAEKLTLNPLFAETGVNFFVQGPLEQQFKKNYMHCKYRRRLEKVQGTYAVWVSSKKPGGEVIFSLSHGDESRLPKKLSVLKPWKTIPEQLSIPERAYGRYYPLYGPFYGARKEVKPPPMAALFAEAPKQLFVFSKRSRLGIKANEPLLIVRYGHPRTLVANIEGEQQLVNSSDLLTEPNGPMVLQSLEDFPSLDKPKTIDEALPIVGPVERKWEREFERNWNKFEDCVGNYMAKHDPSWGLGGKYELYYVKTGRNVTQVKFTKADRKCKLKKYLRLAKKLGLKIYDSRKKARQKALASLKKKFPDS